MAIEIKSPTFPESVADGTVANWVKKEVDIVNSAEIIGEFDDSQQAQPQNKEKTEIKTEGIKVNRAKTVIYFLFDFKPSLSISFLIALLISTKIKTKSAIKRTMLRTNKICKFWSVNSINPLSIKVKKVKKPNDNVIIDNIIR